jgi:hypothetical protein
MPSFANGGGTWPSRSMRIRFQSVLGGSHGYIRCCIAASWYSVVKMVVDGLVHGDARERAQWRTPGAGAYDAVDR